MVGKLLVLRTRNPIDRADGNISKIVALEMMDRSFRIHPLVGVDEKRRYPQNIRMESYEVLIDSIIIPKNQYHVSILSSSYVLCRTSRSDFSGSRKKKLWLDTLYCWS